MNIKSTFQISKEDYKKVYYYSVLQRNSGSLKLMTAVVVCVMLCNIARMAGYISEQFVLMNFLLLGYGAWLVLLFAGAAGSIRRYLKNKNSLIGKTFHVSLVEDKTMVFDVPELSVERKCAIKDLFFVQEMKSAYMIYIDNAVMYILPHSALTEEERRYLRELFSDKIKNKFNSRYLK